MKKFRGIFNNPGRDEENLPSFPLGPSGLINTCGQIQTGRGQEAGLNYSKALQLISDPAF